MACYCGVEVRYRGRLISVGFRYCIYNGADVKKGKSLDFPSPYACNYSEWRKNKDLRKIFRLLRRRGLINKNWHRTLCGNP